MILALLFATKFVPQSSAVDASPVTSLANLQSTLSRTGYLKLPPGVTYISGLKIPEGGEIEGSGGELRPQPGYAGSGITCNSPGFRILNVTLRGFSTGISVSSNQPSDGTGESFISGCRIYDYDQNGIDWDALSDGYIDHCICASTLAPRGDWHNAISPDRQFLRPYGATTSSTANAGIRLGEHAGGVTVSDCHCWGNEWFDIADFAPDSILQGNRLEGGRGAMLLLAAYRIHVIGGTIWSIMNGNQSAAICMGLHTSTKIFAPGNCDVRGVFVNTAGYLPYVVLNDDVGVGNTLSLIAPPDYHPTAKVYPDQNIGTTNRVQLQVEGTSDTGAVWKDNRPLPASGN